MFAFVAQSYLQLTKHYEVSPLVRQLLAGTVDNGRIIQGMDQAWLLLGIGYSFYKMCSFVGLLSADRDLCFIWFYLL